MISFMVSVARIRTRGERSALRSRSVHPSYMLPADLPDGQAPEKFDGSRRNYEMEI
jgi:hypothetical protein